MENFEKLKELYEEILNLVSESSMEEANRTPFSNMIIDDRNERQAVLEAEFFRLLKHVCGEESN